MTPPLCILSQTCLTVAAFASRACICVRWFAASLPRFSVWLLRFAMVGNQALPVDKRMPRRPPDDASLAAYPPVEPAKQCHALRVEDEKPAGLRRRVSLYQVVAVDGQCPCGHHVLKRSHAASQFRCLPGTRTQVSRAVRKAPARG